jgi:superfamily I DNA and/or RNA helicase
MELVTPILKDWQEKLLNTPDVLVDYARSVQVFGSTCLRVPQVTRLLGETPFDYVITDEAAKALDTEVLTPLVEGRRFILVGDQRQLPPYIDQEMENTLEKNAYNLEEVKTSLFEKLFKGAPSTNKSVLRRQFRMHSTIGTDFVGRLFYGDLSEEDLGGLETGVDDAERDLNIPLMKLHKHRVLWFNVTGTERRVRNTFYNPDEASKIAFLLREINKQIREAGLGRLTVSVIAPYLAQVEKLNEEIVPASVLWTHLDIQIPTVDSFQGKETDISIFSVVRTQGNMKFLSDRRRLNVSWSRARRALFIFGDLTAAKANEQIAKAINILPSENLIGVR